MHRHRVQSIFFIAYCMVMMHFTNDCRSDEVLTRKIVDAWKQQHATLKSFHFELDVQTTLAAAPADPGEPERMELKSGSHDDERLFIGQKSAMGANRYYTFELSRSDPNAEDWFLVSLEERLPETTETQSTFESRIAKRIEIVDLRLGLLPVSSLFRETNPPSFSVISSDKDPGTGLLRFEFECEDSEYDAGARKLTQKGVAVVDPEHSYMLVSSKVDFQLEAQVEGAVNCTGESEGKFKYEGKTGLKGLTNISTTDNYESLNLKYNREIKIQTDNKAPGKKQFTLTSFGLPEPEFMSRKGNSRFYLGLGLFGVAMLAIFFVLKGKK